MLQWEEAMKSLARHVCLFAWVLAVGMQLILVTHAPDTLVISGVDMAHENAMVLIHQLIFIGFGLLVAIVAYFAKRWGSYLVVVSAAFYLARWFPFQSVYKYGLSAVAKSMFHLGSNPGVRLSYIMGNIVLPILFVASIVFVVIDSRRPVSTGGDVREPSKEG